MAKVPKLNLALASICQADMYYLQKRTWLNSTPDGGVVGFFGGKIEPGEKAQEAVSREVVEETNLSFANDNYHKVAGFLIPANRILQVTEAKVQVFKLLLPADIKVEAKEGELVSWTKEELIRNDELLTLATKIFIQRYFK